MLVEGGLGALAAVASAPGAGTSPDGAAAPGSGAQASHPPGVVAVALGGCACCTGATVLRVTLTRLLRAGGLHRMLIVVGAAARPEAVAAMLSAPPFDALLEPFVALPEPEPESQSQSQSQSQRGDAARHAGTATAQQQPVDT